MKLELIPLATLALETHLVREAKLLFPVPILPDDGHAMDELRKVLLLL